MNTVGFSSNCSPALTGAGLAALAVDIGAQVVDLRVGRGQGWESDGTAPLRAAGVQPVFVGVSLVLGRPNQPCLPRLAELDRLAAADLPVKVFAAESLGTDPRAYELAVDQAAVLQSVVGQGRLLVETHHGYAAVADLARLCRDTGCRMLLDSLGLARLGVALDEAMLLLRPYVVAMQVKGYDVAAPTTSVHYPLRTMGATYAARLCALLPPGVPVLVESKAGALAEDVSVLRRSLAHDPEGEVGHAPSDHQ